MATSARRRRRSRYRVSNARIVSLSMNVAGQSQQARRRLSAEPSEVNLLGECSDGRSTRRVGRRSYVSIFRCEICIELGFRRAASPRPGVLVHVHSGVGGAQQAVGGVGIIRIKRDADAGRAIEHISVAHEWLVEAAFQARGNFLNFSAIAHLGNQHRELVSAQARQRVAGAQLVLCMRCVTSCRYGSPAWCP